MLMKKRISFLVKKPLVSRWAFLPGLCLAAASSVSAAETNAPAATTPEPLTPEQQFEGGTDSFKNWVDVSTGGYFTSGNKSQFQQGQQSSKVFGGIEDLHYQGEIKKGTTFSIDGHGIFDENNYKLKLAVDREKVGYLRFSIDESRTWYNGDGGFFPPTGTYFPLTGGTLGLDRREISLEGGLTLENKPKITFKYTHNDRDGQKGSTIWGSSTVLPPDTVRALTPSFYDINERSDSFALDVTHTIKKTDVGLGMRYETGKLDDALNISQFPGEPGAFKATDTQGTSYDMFSIHGFSETWLKKNVMLSLGGSFSDLDSTLSGSRIYGTDFDVSNLPVGEFGYFGLNGTSRLDEYVANMNLFYKPTPNFTITPSLRIQKETYDSDVTGQETLADNAPAPFAARSDRDLLDVRERLDVRYTGFTNWTMYARAELTERDGDLNVSGGLGPIAGFGTPPVLQSTDDNSFFQKYSIGTRWYPLRRLSLDVGGYYKLNDYHYDNTVDSTPNGPTSFNRYPAYLVLQDFETYDGNFRLTVRPLNNVSFVSRYEYQISTVETEPAPISGLSQIETSRMTSHILAEDVSWSPWSRLNLQADANYVLSDTKTPGLDESPTAAAAILKSQNNYWTFNFTSGLSINDKTDLKVSYVYYLSDNYVNNSLAGVPYGAGAEEHGITSTLTRRISKNLLLSLKYGYFHYNDVTFGGNQNYDAHLIYSSLRYRF